MLKVSHHRIPVKKNRIVALIIHYFLRAGLFLYHCFSMKFFHKQKELTLKEIKKILIIRTDGLGDVVMSTPAFKSLRHIFPDARITLLAATWSKELVELMPTFDDVIYFDAPWIVKEKRRTFKRLLEIIRKLRMQKFDLAIDLRGDFRNNILMYLCKAKYRMGFSITGCHFLLTHIVPCEKNHHPVSMCISLIKYLNPEDRAEHYMSLWNTGNDREFAVNFFKKNNINHIGKNDLVVIINPGAKWYGRRWLAERFARIADSLIEKYDARVILAGSPSDFGLVRNIASLMKHTPIEAVGKTSLRQFLSLLERSDLFIGVDSGPMHMATAIGTKVIALFGPALQEAIGPWGDGHIVITKQDNFPCSPCAQTVCKRPDNSCMKAITVEEVWETVENQVKRILSDKNNKSYENITY